MISEQVVYDRERKIEKFLLDDCWLNCMQVKRETTSLLFTEQSKEEKYLFRIDLLSPLTDTLVLQGDSYLLYPYIYIYIYIYINTNTLLLLSSIVENCNFRGSGGLIWVIPAFKKKRLLFTRAPQKEGRFGGQCK